MLSSFHFALYAFIFARKPTYIHRLHSWISFVGIRFAHVAQHSRQHTWCNVARVYNVSSLSLSVSFTSHRSVCVQITSFSYIIAVTSFFSSLLNMVGAREVHRMLNHRCLTKQKNNEKYQIDQIPRNTRTKYLEKWVRGCLVYVH